MINYYYIAYVSIKELFPTLEIPKSITIFYKNNNYKKFLLVMLLTLYPSFFAFPFLLLEFFPIFASF